jgi:uncharacterized protein YdaU (DUF1376 family)
MSREMPWFKFFPDDFLKGVRGLSLEERGAYMTVLAMMYDRGGAIPDDERWICGNLGCDVRVWRRIKDRLSRLGKIIPDKDGTIANRRVLEEVTSAAAIAEVRRKSGIAGGYQSAISRRQSLKTNENVEANASPSAAPILRSSEEDTPLSPPRGAERGRKIPDDWAPDDALRNYAADLGLSLSETDAAASDFVAYWLGRTDRTARKTAGGWRQTFQTRLRAIVTSTKLRAELKLVHVAPKQQVDTAAFRAAWLASGKPWNPAWGDEPQDLFATGGTR